MSSEEDGFGFEEVDTEGSQATNTAQVEYNPNRYRVIKSSNVMKRCKAEVEKVKSVTGDTLAENKIRLLLNKYQWDVEKFLEKFYTDENFASSLVKADTVEVPVDEKRGESSRQQPQATTSRRITTRSISRKRNASGLLHSEEDEPVTSRRKIQVTVLTSSAQNSQSERSRDVVEEIPKCEICFDPIGKKLHTWNCGHKFCSDCFKDYLIEKITCNSLTAIFQCPGFKCSTVLSDNEIMKALDKIHVDKYLQVITNQYVQSKRMLRWCPGKNCTYAVEVFDTVKQPAVRCKCGHFFCFSCAHFGHDLISCELVKKFELMKSNDYATANWIAENCKQCPKCKAEINKNGGCNHMTCGKCTHEFCWICFENWSVHSSLPCKGFKIDPRSNAKVSSRRLVACVSKYANMIDSIQKDEKNYKKYIAVQEKKAAEETEIWYKVDFIIEATNLILRCRRLLCDSYILEFFMENPNNTHWLSFEMSQRELSQHTENLSSMMEHDINAENMHEMKQKLHTHVVCCKSLFNAVYEKATEGFQYGLWKDSTE